MPLYDCVLLFKPKLAREALIDLVSKVGKHVYRRNGVVTDIKSFGDVQLGYGIKKLDGKHFQGQMMQMTMMTPPSFNNELHYLNKEDRLLRWLLIKHRDFRFGSDILTRDGLTGLDSHVENDGPLRGDLRDFVVTLNEPDEGGGFFSKRNSDDDDEEDDDEEDDDNEGDEIEP